MNLLDTATDDTMTPPGPRIPITGKIDNLDIPTGELPKQMGTIEQGVAIEGGASNIPNDAVYPTTPDTATLSRQRTTTPITLPNLNSGNGAPAVTGPR